MMILRTSFAKKIPFHCATDTRFPREGAELIITKKSE